MPSLPERGGPRWTEQSIEQIIRWTPFLWSIRTGKPSGFRFRPGHYARLGLVGDDLAIVWRPYSIVSAPNENFLEFLVTLIPGGIFTNLLAKTTASSAVLIESLAMGFFLPDQLARGESLWMLATGAGLGPYIAMLRDGGVLHDFPRLVLVHSVRFAEDLAYREEIEAFVARSPALKYVPIVTRQAAVSPLGQRIPELVRTGQLESHVHQKLEPDTGRVMVCGNPEFTTDMRQLLSLRGFQPCRRGFAGSMVFEKYW